MIYQNSNQYMTDDLERRLIQNAIEEQFRYRPIAALKYWFKRLFA